MLCSECCKRVNRAASIEASQPSHGVLRSPMTTVANDLKMFVTESKQLFAPSTRTDQIATPYPSVTKCTSHTRKL